MDNTPRGDGSLRKTFIEPPFSILDAKSTHWQVRKKRWRELGIQSELGRTVDVYKGTLSFNNPKYNAHKVRITQSIFDPVLCEILYHWFSEPNGLVLDPFAGGSVRGIVAHCMDRRYTGIDIRPEQVAANYSVT